MPFLDLAQRGAQPAKTWTRAHASEWLHFAGESRQSCAHILACHLEQMDRPRARQLAASVPALVVAAWARDSARHGITHSAKCLRNISIPRPPGSKAGTGDFLLGMKNLSSPEHVSLSPGGEKKGNASPWGFGSR